MALEAYYKQARNLDAEREAANVRLRAERRVGELLNDLAKTEPAERAERANATMGRSSSAGTNVAPSPYAQALADIPAETFERALRAPDQRDLPPPDFDDPVPTSRSSPRRPPSPGAFRVIG
jgi:hypothetical protein